MLSLVLWRIGVNENTVYLWKTLTNAKGTRSSDRKRAHQSTEIHREGESLANYYTKSRYIICVFSACIHPNLYPPTVSDTCHYCPYYFCPQSPRLPISGDLFWYWGAGGDGTVVESPLRGHPTNSMSCVSVWSPARPTDNKSPTKPHTTLYLTMPTHPYASIRLITTFIYNIQSVIPDVSSNISKALQECLISLLP